jgi:hypothetical protein
MQLTRFNSMNSCSIFNLHRVFSAPDHGADAITVSPEEAIHDAQGIPTTDMAKQQAPLIQGFTAPTEENFR